MSISSVEYHLMHFRRDQIYRVRGRDLSREIVSEMACNKVGKNLAQ